MSEGCSSNTVSEPEPGPDTVSGVRQIGESSTKYTVFADIRETHEKVLPELRLIEKDGQWVMQEPQSYQEPETCVQQTKDDQDTIEVQAALSFSLPEKLMPSILICGGQFELISLLSSPSPKSKVQSP